MTVVSTPLEMSSGPLLAGSSTTSATVANHPIVTTKEMVTSTARGSSGSRSRGRVPTSDHLLHIRTLDPALHHQLTRSKLM